MAMNDSDALSSAKKTMERSDRQLFEGFVVVLTATLAFAFIISLFDYQPTNPILPYIIQGSLIATSIIMVIYRKTSPLSILHLYPIVTMTIAAIWSGLLFGLASSTLIFVIFNIILGCAAFGWTVCVVMCIISAVFYTGLGYAVVTGAYALDTDADNYARSMQAWLLAGSAAITMAAFISQMFYQFVRHQTRLLRSLFEQKQHIEYLANHDALTGLPSLRLTNALIDHALVRAKRTRGQVALLFLDLDGFKNVNDTHGHDIGDDILKQTAERIRSTLRKSDVACRIGGDEFLILLEAFGDRTTVMDICQRLVNGLAEPFYVDDLSVTISSSVGGAIFPQHATNQTELRGRADQAMYEIKKSGKNNFKIAA